MNEHDPLACQICSELGSWSDWSNTFDTISWFEAHESIGVGLEVAWGRVYETTDLVPCYWFVADAPSSLYET